MHFTENKFVLGSASPRRSLLLKEAGITFRTLVSNTGEVPLPHLTGSDIAVYLAEEKATLLRSRIDDTEILITADTIVWIGNEMLNKPANESEAFEMLTRLNGNKHYVFTGIHISNKEKKKSFFVQSEVLFRKVSDDMVRDYIRIFKPYDKAGSYGAQETLGLNVNPCSKKEIDFMNRIGKNNLFERTMQHENKNRIVLIDHIEGSYFNVMGLPVAELFDELENFTG